MGTLNEDMFINGLLSARQLAIPSGTVVDDDVAANALIAATKMQHQHRRGYTQGSTTTASSTTQVIHHVYGATGTVIGIEAGCVVACLTTATITVDLKKNNVSILSAVISLTNAQTARQTVEGVLSSSALVDDDVLEIVVVASASGGTLGQGLFVSLTVNEDPA